MQWVSPYLNFKGDAEEAFAFYKSVFGTEFDGILRFREFGGSAMGVAEADLDKIAHISLPLTGEISLMASDVVGQDAEAFVAGNNVNIYLEADSAEEADRLFEGLSEGGQQEMPLMQTEWAEKYGMCVDRFGIHWMISFTGEVSFSF